MSSPTKEKAPHLPKKQEVQKSTLEDKKSFATKPILMTRRELTDPFGSDEEEEPLAKEPVQDTKSAVEAYGTLVNGLETSPKDKKDDIFSDLPKPNIVSAFF